jgi:acyl CoA:acetate/3-ketoacid CoA transferase beta subunit
MTSDPAELAAFVDRVLRAPDGAAAYRAYVGEDRLTALSVPAGHSGAARHPRPPAGPTERRTSEVAAAADPASADHGVDLLIVAGARQLMARIRAIGAQVLIAGIGQAFFAARLAQQQLAQTGYALRVMVETGLYDVDCGIEGHGYLLAYDNITRARRLSSVDDILGVLTCGADNRCVAALGAAQIDRDGNLNSTRLGGKLLVGSGGACDIAASAAEVVVMTRLLPGRLVGELEYITSPGHGVRSVVTDRCLLTRATAARGAWTISEVAPMAASDLAHAIAALERDCPWPLTRAAELGFTPPITTDELQLLDVLDPTGKYRHRAG